MRHYLILLFSIFFVVSLIGQDHFPVKVDRKWGLIDRNGNLSLSPSYDAIGEFEQFGYAVMQRNGQVGLLGEDGKEILNAKYEDLKVLDSLLVAVMTNGAWEVVNLQGEVVLEKGYERVKVLSQSYVAYRLDGKWGLINQTGKEIVAPIYDDIIPESSDYFLVRKANHLGLISTKGQQVVHPEADEIRLYDDALIFYRVGKYWGAVDTQGRERIQAKYLSYQKLNSNFLKLFTRTSRQLYSLSCERIITREDEYTDFLDFSNRYVSVRKGQQIGLLNECGQVVLSTRYQEIQPYASGLFRANLAGSWGLVSEGDSNRVAFAYQYIAPPQGPVSLVKQAHKFGVINQNGVSLVAPQFKQIEIEKNKVKAYSDPTQNGQSIRVFNFDKDGLLTENEEFTQHFDIQVRGKDAGEDDAAKEQNSYLLAQFEWFYAPEEDRWGLRRLSDGETVIPPQFHEVQVDQKLGLSLVGIRSQNNYDFERTTFRFEMTYGLVLNNIGKPVTDIDFLDLRLADFRAGLPLARVVFANGKHGLIDKTGLIVRKDLAYIGDFSNGAASVSLSGRLSGSLKERNALNKLSSYLAQLRSSVSLLDYTQYDQLFQQDAYLICEDCVWGFIDTLGKVITPPRYSFVYNFVNESAIVAKDDKWGLINKQGVEVVACQYDNVEYLENTNHKVIKVYREKPKYGLIDTLGQLAINAVYEEIGQFKDGLLAVQQNGLWGFVDVEGDEVIPCQYKEVQTFSEGLAAVRNDRLWGYINKNNEIVIDFQYRRAGNFSNGISWVFDENSTGYIDRKNRWVISPQFSRAFDFFQGVARVVVETDWGLIDGEGKFIQKPRYTDIGPFNELGLAVVQYGDSRSKYGLIDLSGELVTKNDFRAIEGFSEGMAAVKGRNGWGFINIYGELVIPTKYARVGPFNEGRAMVQINGQCGYIDRSGKLAIPCQFSRCQDFSDGRAVVYRGLRKAGIIDQDGELIIDTSLDRLLTFREGRGLMRDDQYRFYYITEQSGLYNGYYDKATAFRHGLAVVQIDGKWGIINHRGIEIIPPKYDKIDGFENGFAKVKIEGYSGLNSLDGQQIAAPEYEFIAYAGNGLFRVEQGDKLGYFDQSGNWVWELQR